MKLVFVVLLGMLAVASAQRKWGRQSNPRCPLQDLSIQCVRRNDECQTDGECERKGQGDICCPINNCGNKCLPLNAPTNLACPATDLNLFCIIRNDACNSDIECQHKKEGDICCPETNCGNQCMPKPAPKNPRCPRTQFQFACERKIDQCQTDGECKRKGLGDGCCKVTNCGNECITLPPPISQRCPATNPTQCSTIFDDCQTDVECKRGDRGDICCPVTSCGKECIPFPPPPVNPRCPKPDLSIQCITRNDQCTRDGDCRRTGRGDMCCDTSGCGNECLFYTNQNPKCPNPELDRHCTRESDQCSSDEECMYNGRTDICCQVNGCGKECMSLEKAHPNPRCQKVDVSKRCAIFHDQCENDEDCTNTGRGDMCCHFPSCGKECTRFPPLTNQEEECPDPRSFGIRCFHFNHSCHSDSSCSDGTKCCLVSQCGNSCHLPRNRTLH